MEKMAEKGILSLVGIGNSDELGITLAGLAELSRCGAVFAESYTNLMPEGTLLRLEGLCKKKITLLSREQVESEKALLESACKERTALVVSGDPMIATTHVSLVLSARQRGIAVNTFHAASILSAAMGESGLQAYKFGKTVTLAYWRENYRPMTTYDVIADNLSRGLHTLLLLDIDEKMGPMKPSVAAETLLEMEKEGKRKIISENTKLVLLRGIGWASPTRKYCSLSELPKFDKAKGPSVIIFPSSALHFIELEFLESL